MASLGPNELKMQTDGLYYCELLTSAKHHSSYLKDIFE